jgi:hypothetical protein
MKKRLLGVALFVMACQAQAPEGTTPGDCHDNLDNDNDGTYDCQDDGCTADDRCVEQKRTAAINEKNASKTEKKPLTEKQKKDLEEKRRPYFMVDGLKVQKRHNGQDINLNDAKVYCYGLVLDGIDDWRLPDRKEAVKIVESDQLYPDSYVMWTSTMKGKKRAIIVGITSKAVNDLGISFDGQCRAKCVQGSAE